jgi:hypothetical protein
MIFDHIQYPFVKVIWAGIIDRENYRQKKHGRKITTEKSRVEKTQR